MKKQERHASQEPAMEPRCTLTQKTFIHTHTEVKTPQMCSHASCSSKNATAVLGPRLGNVIRSRFLIGCFFYIFPFAHVFKRLY